MPLTVITALLAASNPTVPTVQQPAAAPVTNPEMVKEKKIAAPIPSLPERGCANRFA